MRILIAHSFYRLEGGEDRYVTQLADLVATRHEVEVLDVRNAALEPNLRTAARMVWSSRTVREIRARIEAFRPDLVHVHNVYPSLGPAVHIASEETGVPLVATVHNLRLRCPNGLMFTEDALCTRCCEGNYSHSIIHKCFPRRSQSVAYAGALWIHRFMMKLEDKVRLFVAPSEFLRQRLLSWGVSPERISLVRNFTDLTSPLGPSAREGFGLYVGRLSSEKGVSELLRALEAAGDPPFRVVGAGPEEPRIVDLARKLGLRRIEFLGWRSPDEAHGLLSKAGYAVFPSQSNENAPLAALEAMMAGCPMVTSDRGGLPELTADGRGMSYAAGDVMALANRIRQVRESGEAIQMGSRAQTFARRVFTPHAHLGELERVFASVAAGPQEPRPS